MVRCVDLFDAIPSELLELFAGKEYPWEIVGNIKKFLEKEISKEGLYELFDGVFVGRDVKISRTAEIVGPTVIMDGAEIRPGAYIRGSAYIGRRCVVGNSTEVKNSILFDSVNVPHYNYVGDSILGRGAHMGAGAIASNLKADKSNVIVHGDKEYNTELRKLGAILGDGADVGCGCVLNPGSIVGKHTRIYPLTSVRGVVPERVIMKSSEVIVPRN